MAKPKRIVAQGVTAADCVKALRVTYKPPAYAFFEQVANGTGWAAKRWADAIAMGIWPSRGMLISGFEIKVTRTDWKKELDHPEKAEQIQSYCDQWWIVTPKGLLDVEELPPTWGLYEVDEKAKGYVKIAAPVLTPKPVTRQFMAAILRRHSEAYEDLVRRERHEAKEEGALSGAGEIGVRLERAEKEAATLQERIDEFEKKSGLDITGWQHGEIADAVKVLTGKSRHNELLERLTRDAEAYEHQAKRLRNEIAEISTVKPLEPTE